MTQPEITLCGFEGPEKLFEIWFTKPSPAYCESFKRNGLEEIDTDIQMEHVSLPGDGLRAISKEEWDVVLTKVGCQVLSTLENEHGDAYLLSESSMFVFSHRLTLKTCGTTKLLGAVPLILELARERCNLTSVEAVFYSRKAFFFPEKQVFPHNAWDNEVEYLDTVFEPQAFDTAAYVIGKVNGDHWCLYLATPLMVDTDGNAVRAREVDETIGDDEDDVTLEILMQDLDPEAMKVFWRTESEVQLGKAPHNVNAVKHILPRRIYKETKTCDIYPDALLDDYVFDPCGYSANGLLGPYYFTIHVTPESHCSYASFETTVPVKSLKHLARTDVPEYDSFAPVIDKVTSIFRPGKFSTTLFVRRSLKTVFEKSPLRAPLGYRHRERILHSLGGWELEFSHFEKKVGHEVVGSVVDH